MADALKRGDVVTLDLTGKVLEAEHCVGGTEWFDENGDVRINFDKLRIAAYASGHMTTRTDVREGGWTRKVDVRFEPYLKDESVRAGKWFVEAVDEYDEYERGPGGNGSMYRDTQPIGKKVIYRLRQGRRTLEFTTSTGYTLHLPLERATVVGP